LLRVQEIFINKYPEKILNDMSKNG
jgi:hypothetical protein